MSNFSDYSSIYLEFKEYELKASIFDKYSKIVAHSEVNKGAILLSTIRVQKLI